MEIRSEYNKDDNEYINPLRNIANKLADKKNKNNPYNIYINKQDTHIPINLPVSIIGEKGSGKTTLIKAIVEATNKTVFNNIYFIYSSLTSDQVLPNNVIKIDVNDCDDFLSMLFASKSIFNSYSRFFKSLNFKTLQAKYNERKLTEEDIFKHIDNNIIKYNKTALNALKDPHIKIDKIVDTGIKIIEKFAKPFFIGPYRMNGFKYNDRDAIIIDDIAIAAKILFKQIKDNPIYEYLTLTRHMRLFVLFSGQQIEQVPKSIRREIMCWIISKNSNLELLKGILSKETLREIQDKQRELKKFEFVVYNMFEGTIDKI